MAFPTLRCHPGWVVDLVVVHERELVVGHVDLGRQIAVDLQQKRGRYCTSSVKQVSKEVVGITMTCLEFRW